MCRCLLVVCYSYGLTRPLDVLLQISDRVSRGEATDLSGPAMVDVLTQSQHVNVAVVATAAVPDDVAAIQAAVTKWTDGPNAVDLVLTSGGTGFSPRDVTPEAIKVRCLLCICASCWWQK